MSLSDVGNLIFLFLLHLLSLSPFVFSSALWKLWEDNVTGLFFLYLFVCLFARSKGKQDLKDPKTCQLHSPAFRDDELVSWNAFKGSLCKTGWLLKIAFLCCPEYLCKSTHCCCKKKDMAANLKKNTKVVFDPQIISLCRIKCVVISYLWSSKEPTTQ